MGIAHQNDTVNIAHATYLSRINYESDILLNNFVSLLSAVKNLETAEKLFQLSAYQLRLTII